MQADVRTKLGCERLRLQSSLPALPHRRVSPKFDAFTDANDFPATATTSMANPHISNLGAVGGRHVF